VRPGLTEKKPQAMKKLLFAALLSLAGVGLGNGQAKAWWPFHHHCCAGSASICVRPYNAFSPSVFGTVTADGCFPLSFGNHGTIPPPPPWLGQPPWMNGGAGCGMDGAACGGTCLTGPGGGAMLTAPVAGTPVMLPGSPATFQAPAPAPLPSAPAGPTTGVQPYPVSVQTAGYPGYGR